MTTNIVTIPSDGTFAEARELMRLYRIRHIPVIDKDGRLAGLISLRHIIDELFEITLFTSFGLESAASGVSALLLRSADFWFPLLVATICIQIVGFNVVKKGFGSSKSLIGFSLLL
jgi:CBS-domain-containing membrane protein